MLPSPFGVLWLDTCRQSHAGKLVVEGLKRFLPRGCSALTRERMAQLDSDAAKWQLFELEERNDALLEIDYADCSNISIRLVHCPAESAGRARFAESIQRIKKLISEAEVNVLSPGEVAFRLHGLEFARARVARDPRSFCAGQEIAFGLGAEECVLQEKNFNQFHTSCVQRGRGTPSRRSPVITHSSAFTRSAGLNPWLCPTSVPSTSDSIPPVCIPRFPLFRPPIAP